MLSQLQLFGFFVSLNTREPAKEPLRKLLAAIERVCQGLNLLLTSESRSRLLLNALDSPLVCDSPPALPHFLHQSPLGDLSCTGVLKLPRSTLALPNGENACLQALQVLLEARSLLEFDRLLVFDRQLLNLPLKHSLVSQSRYCCCC